jgi:hypothetical protein
MKNDLPASNFAAALREPTIDTPNICIDDFNQLLHSMTYIDIRHIFLQVKNQIEASRPRPCFFKKKKKKIISSLSGMVQMRLHLGFRGCMNSVSSEPSSCGSYY